MSNSEYIGKWRFRSERSILEIFEEEGSLMWRWIVWRGLRDNSSTGSCKDWRPSVEIGFTRIYEFKDYLKRL